MTWRALTIGLAAGLFISSAGYINDRLLELESFNSGHLIPVIVLGLTFIVMALINPILFHFRRNWALRPAEMAVIIVLSTAACSIPGRGLMEQFTQNIIMPYHWNRVNPGWQEHGLMSYVPPGAMVAVTEENYDRTVGAYIMGAPASADAPSSWLAGLLAKCERVPWDAWRPALLTWLPMVFLCGVCMACMSLVVHRQWSSHEFLSYPIADFTTSLIQREAGDPFPTVFRNRLFWIGFAVIFAIRVNNGLCCWFPEYMIPIRLDWYITPFGQLFPSVYKVEWGGALFRVNLFPLVAAFAFFLSAEVSLTLGLTQIMYVLFALPLVSVGINMSTQYTLGGWNGWMRAGSYTAFAATLLYAGRHYYGQLLRKAVCLWRTEKETDGTVWAFRFLGLASCLLVFGLIRLGLDFPFAVATVFLMLLAYVVVSRISAETGLFFIQPRWQPIGVLMAMLGGYAMGPKSIMVCTLAGTVLCIDQSQALMPYLVNGLKLSENVKLKPASMTWLTFSFYVFAVLAAVAVVLVATYDFGTPTSYNWSYERVPSMPFRAVEQEVLKLKAVGCLAEVEALPWHRRLGTIIPKENFWLATLIGIAFVTVCSVLRMRVRWWPIHPVMFLVWATYPMSFTCYSFLIGWFIKKMTVRFGGNQAVKKLKPLMIGVIAGEILGALVFMIVGAIYYFKTGTKPISYRYFPR